MSLHTLLSEQLEAGPGLASEVSGELAGLLRAVDATYRRFEQHHIDLEEELDRARELVAAVARCRPDRVIFLAPDGTISAAVGRSGQDLDAALGEPLELWDAQLAEAVEGDHERVHLARFGNGSTVVLDVEESSTSSGRAPGDQLLRAALEATADGLLLLDRKGSVSYANQTFTDFWGLDDAGNDALDRVSRQLARPEKLEHLRQLQHGDRLEEQAELETRDGRFVELFVKPHTLDSEVVGSVWSFRDITQRKKSKDALTYFAYHDQLTSLPNRRMFLERLEQGIAQSRRVGTKLLVAFVDLDRFKQINDSLGHTVGDDYLSEVAVRLESRTRTEDTVARLAGDEFALLINNVNSERAIYVVAEGLLDVLREPLHLEGHRLAIRASVGLALFPDDAEEAEDLLARADGAMYDAKAPAATATASTSPTCTGGPSSACVSRTICVPPSRGASSSSTTSRRCLSPTARSPASKLSCAGRARTACATPGSSSTSPRNRVSSRRSATSCSTKRAGSRAG